MKPVPIKYEVTPFAEGTWALLSKGQPVATAASYQEAVALGIARVYEEMRRRREGRERLS